MNKKNKRDYRRKPLHYPSPNKKYPGSIFRASACQPDNGTYLDESIIKESNPTKSAFRVNRLSFDFDLQHQCYYTLDKSRVECKNCLRVINKSESNVLNNEKPSEITEEN